MFARPDGFVARLTEVASVMVLLSGCVSTGANAPRFQGSTLAVSQQIAVEVQQMKLEVA